MHERSPTDCSHCAQSEVAHPVACFGCQTCQFTCDHYICTKYVAPKLCVKCRGVITTSLLEGDERCVKCADFDPNDPDNSMSKGPCENEDCDLCYPLTRYKISTERVQRLFHTREIKASCEAEALRIYNEGTAWPSSYDDRDGEILEQHAPVVTVVPPLEEPLRSRVAKSACYHNLPSHEEFMKKGH